MLQDENQPQTPHLLNTVPLQSPSGHGKDQPAGWPPRTTAETCVTNQRRTNPVGLAKPIPHTLHRMKYIQVHRNGGTAKYLRKQSSRHTISKAWSRTTSSAWPLPLEEAVAMHGRTSMHGPYTGFAHTYKRVQPCLLYKLHAQYFAGSKAALLPWHGHRGAASCVPHSNHVGCHLKGDLKTKLPSTTHAASRRSIHSTLT